MRLLAIVQKRVLLWGLSCCLLVTLNSHAQERDGTKKITGKITSSSDNKTIPYASICIKGTQTGVTSDKDGSFAIDAKEGDVLVISIIGYQRKEVKVGKGGTLSVKLEQNALKLDDVVVI